MLHKFSSSGLKNLRRTAVCDSTLYFRSGLARMSSGRDNEINNADAGQNAPVKPKLRIKDILKEVEMSRFTVNENSSIGDGIHHLVEERRSSSLMINSEGSVTGIFTARDLLKYIHEQNITHGTRSVPDDMFNAKLCDIGTRKDKLIYCSPNDSVRRCREIMFQCKIRNMPVIDNGEAKGIITLKHLADSSFSVLDTGGKKGFIHNITGRKGIPEGTKISKTAMKKSTQTKLDLEVASYELPHPFKMPEGVAMSRRHYGANEFCDDVELCEDSHFAVRVADPLEGDEDDAGVLTSFAAFSPDKQDQPKDVATRVYMCVADGVGSWRQYNVDPRQYSHKLVENALKVIESDAEHRKLMDHSPFDRDLDPLHPLDIIMDAWNMTTTEGVMGSSTICVATLDNKLNQLSYSNVGDCGLMVIRHIDSETAGYMRERQRPRHLRKNDLKVAYISQQQLRSFNLPYQLGYSTLPQHVKGNGTSFESPADADTASISVLPGDIIVMATDGLFDNVDLDEIVEEVSDWEEQWFPSAYGEALQSPSAKGEEAMQELSKRLVEKARLLSLDKNRDSPFAILAKENDIMWGGGMPDDATVVVARVIAKPKEGSQLETSQKISVKL